LLQKQSVNSIPTRLIFIIKIINMKYRYFPGTITRYILSVFFLVIFQNVIAQKPPGLPDTSKMTYNQISNGMKVYVFPSKNQSQQKQKKDEFDCYKWAMDQTGYDPMNPPKVQAAPAETGPTGGAVKGAARGAAAGVAIGAIAGDAGKGAAIGATAGGLAGRRAGKQAQAQQNQQAQATATKTEQDLKNDYVKAFSACIEGKGYTIK
jgi:hypothetical protein